MNDLRAALFLAELADIQVATGPNSWFAPQLPTVAPLFEASCLATELELPPRVSSELIRTIRDDLGTSLSGALSRRAIQADASELLDRYYTDDGNGDGWLVLSAAGDRSWTRFGRPPGERTRLWNLASCFFNDRRTMAARLVGLSGRFDAIDQSTFAEIMRDFVTTVSSTGRRGGTVFDGPLAPLLGELDAMQIQHAMIIVARRRAAMVLLALNEFFTEHARFPDSLDELTPRFLSEVPLDANAAREFRYERRGTGFSLGSHAVMASDLSMQWWYPMRFPQESYAPAREQQRLNSPE
jgi:hypothetical protein